MPVSISSRFSRSPSRIDHSWGSALWKPTEHLKYPFIAFPWLLDFSKHTCLTAVLRNLLTRSLHFKTATAGWYAEVTERNYLRLEAVKWGSGYFLPHDTQECVVIKTASYYPPFW